MNYEEIKKKGEEIISNFKHFYLNNDGLISINYPPNKETIFNNFDDIAPFFIFFQETNFLIDQVIKMKKILTFESVHSLNDLIFSHRLDEYIGGLYCLWRSSNNEEIWQSQSNNF